MDKRSLVWKDMVDWFLHPNVIHGRTAPMEHENIPTILEDLEARIVAIRDSL